MIAKVMLTDSHHILDGVFDYKIPDELSKKAVVGMRVLVPFGVRNATAEGLIVELAEKSEYEKLKSLKSCMDETPVCNDELLELCRWMQRRYLCSFQQAYKQIKPPYVGTRVKNWVVLKETDFSDLTPAQVKFCNALAELDNVAELEEVEAYLGKSLKKTAYTLCDKGIIDITEKIDENISFRYIRKAHLICNIEEGFLLADELKQSRAEAQSRIVLALCDCGDTPTSELMSLADSSYTSLNALVEKGYVSIYKERIERLAYSPEKYQSTKAYEPTDEQKPVINHLNKLIDKNIHEEILLRGVTGSGKTEVFLQAIDTCLKNNKQAIMLVPEISLTPQMVERFVSRFGNAVAVMHSGLSQGERFEQWQKIRNNEVDVVVGARGAIFAPFENIGIIILDEEHETSYKSETAPRYHARDIAIFRAIKQNAPVLFASATPSVASYYYAKKGRYKLFEMHKRYNENALPKARIVDMRSELLDYHNTSSISIRLQEEIRQNLQKKEKTILFLNRRGFNTFVSCRECGYVMECPECSIALTYHKNTDKLVCHYCGHTKNNVLVCPECGSKYVKFFGTGTQKIEQELNTLFPEARILRMDFDTTSGKGGHEAILDKFKRGEADILLGTQMVTKGLDFPDVTLAGVLAADSSLNIDDFRANERSFSLITQVCGRAGRGDAEGRAVIQTYQPDNATIVFAKEQNYEAFYENEIVFRGRMEYPPFCDIVYIMLSGENEKEVKAEIDNIGGVILKHLSGEESPINVIGPAPSPIARIKNKYRYRMLIKVKNANKVLPILRAINTAHNNGKTENTLVIDVNPINMI